MHHIMDEIIAEVIIVRGSKGFVHQLLNSRAVVDFGRRSSYHSEDDHVRNQARLSVRLRLG